MNKQRTDNLLLMVATYNNSQSLALKADIGQVGTQNYIISLSGG